MGPIPSFNLNIFLSKTLNSSIALMVLELITDVSVSVKNGGNTCTNKSLKPFHPQ